MRFKLYFSELIFLIARNEVSNQIAALLLKEFKKQCSEDPKMYVFVHLRIFQYLQVVENFRKLHAFDARRSNLLGFRRTKEGAFLSPFAKKLETVKGKTSVTCFYAWFNPGMT